MRTPTDGPQLNSATDTAGPTRPTGHGETAHRRERRTSEQGVGSSVHVVSVLRTTMVGTCPSRDPWLGSASGTAARWTVLPGPAGWSHGTRDRRAGVPRAGLGRPGRRERVRDGGGRCASCDLPVFCCYVAEGRSRTDK